jgi:protein-disulfide isomerase
LPPSDAFIPPYALTRYDGITAGKTDGAPYPIGFPALGDPAAPLKITEFSTYACNLCRVYFEYYILELLPAIRAGQVYFVLVPVTTAGYFDPSNGTAFAFCALDQGAFWPVNELLFNWQVRYNADAANFDRLQRGALQLGLDMDKLDKCLIGTSPHDRIAATNKYTDGLAIRSYPAVMVNGVLQDKLPNLNQLFGMIGTLNLNPPTATPVSP